MDKTQPREEHATDDRTSTVATTPALRPSEPAKSGYVGDSNPGQPTAEYVRQNLRTSAIYI